MRAVVAPRLAVVMGVAASLGLCQTPEPLSGAEIIERMVAADQARTGRLAGYTSARTYRIENKRTGLLASMKVAVSAEPGGAKRFRIVEMKGPKPVRQMVFERMLDTESKSSQKGSQEQTRIAPENYSFRYAGTATDRGRLCHLFEATPRSSNPLLFRGLIWVDAEEFAVTRIEGTPAQRPSWWVVRTSFVHEYQKVGDQWLALSNRSESEIRLFGRTSVLIDYGNYEMPPPARVAAGE